MPFYFLINSNKSPNFIFPYLVDHPCLVVVWYGLPLPQAADIWGHSAFPFPPSEQWPEEE